MAAQCGSSFLLKVDISSTQTTIAGLQTRSLKIDNELVDITNDSSSKWREVLGACGTRSMSVSGSGIFTDAATDEELRGLIMAGNTDSYEIEVPDFGTFAGTFLITELEFTGEHNNAVQFSISLESSGAVTFTAA